MDNKDTQIFHSTTGRPAQVALMSGHVAYVMPEGSPLEPRFWKEAIRMGCSPAGFEIDAEQEAPIADPMEHLKAVMRAMIEANEEGDFTAAGVPNMKRLCAKAGYNVPREQMAQAWFEITEADADAE